ncbi:MAG: hypothetical protein ACRC13_14895 [Tannerellaceae bacterium]
MRHRFDQDPALLSRLRKIPTKENLSHCRVYKAMGNASVYLLMKTFAPAGKMIAKELRWYQRVTAQLPQSGFHAYPAVGWGRGCKLVETTTQHLHENAKSFPRRLFAFITKSANSLRYKRKHSSR